MKPIIAANWKMHKNNGEVKEFLDFLPPDLSAELWIAPAAVALHLVANSGKCVAGAQNIYFEREGAFTGEISAEQVKSAGARFVIIGHSERRRLFGETQPQIEKKIALAIEFGLTPLLCVGETLEERKNGKTRQVLESQLFKNFKGIIAYEPVWAIGTGQVPTGDMIAEAHAICKEISLSAVLYGGSVSPGNISSLKTIKGVDGVLVGGASLDPISLMAIVEGFLA